MDLTGKTLFITGASRGIGLAIALRAARDGANVVVAAKTVVPHRHLPGTIYSAAKAIESAGGRAMPLALDVRDREAVRVAVDSAAERFGGLDIVVNNASAIFRVSTEKLESKQYDLMHEINVRGTFAVSQAAIRYLRAAANPHVLTLSPPITLRAECFKGHVAYTMSKYAMSMCAIGMSMEFADQGIAFNCLWPRFGIATSAIEFAVANKDELRRCRTPEIMADAAYAILTKPARSCSGNCFIDDKVLAAEGCTDWLRYKVDPDCNDLRRGMFLDPSDLPPSGSS